MLELWAPADIIVGFVVVVTLGSPVVYAWCDRWLDRTRNSTTDKVNTKDEFKKE